MPTASRIRSTADVRRATVLARALTAFARTGFHATPVSDVAAAAGISQGYVIRLFGTKLDLFVAVIDDCFARIVRALAEGADEASGAEPDDVIEAMSSAYVDLIADRDLLMLQVHAQSASDIPQVRAAMQKGLAAVAAVVSDRSHGTPEQVQRFIAYGQLCHLIVTADLDHVDASWARTLTRGMSHVEPAPAGAKPPKGFDR